MATTKKKPTVDIWRARENNKSIPLQKKKKINESQIKIAKEDETKKWITKNQKQLKQGNDISLPINVL